MPLAGSWGPGTWPGSPGTVEGEGRGEKRKGEGEGVRVCERVIERGTGGIFGICFVSYYNVDISHDTLNYEQ